MIKITINDDNDDDSERFIAVITSIIIRIII
jgi:hypothetical protein